MSRWQRYWFAEGGRTALAIVRIAVALSVLFTLMRIGELPALVAPERIYRPVGIWMLLGDTPPPALLVELLWVLAWAGTIAMLLGLASRIAVAVSLVAGVGLASLVFSGSLTWSHQYNVVFLAQIALLGGRVGDTLSLDAAIRRWRGLPAIDVPRGYQWSLRLVQLAVALMFVGAFFHKFAHGQFTLRWVFSDNLRHHLLVRYDLAGHERPPLVEWLIDEPWRYRTAAGLNMISQLAPLAAILFVRRPLVRAVAGLFFIAEVIALGLVVNLWNQNWLPLAAVFVDWDRLIAWAARRLGRSPPAPASAPADWRPPRGPRVFVLGFVVYEIVTSFVPTLDQRLNTYPFSGFPMFSTIRANPPYGEHRPYCVAGDHFSALAAQPLEPYAQRYLDHGYRGLHVIKQPPRLRARLIAIKAAAQQRYPWFGFTGLRHHLTLFESPAHPEPARFEMHPVAITGELRPDHQLATVLGRWRGNTVELRPQHVDLTGARLIYYADDCPTPHELPAVRDGNTFTLLAPLYADPVYIVAVIGDQQWLVASKRSWVWR